MYMSNHPDTLVAYAKWYGKVSEPMTGAEMTSIDIKSMTLTCSLKNGAKKVVRVPIEPPLKGYDDVKPRLLEMKAIAQEKLGMIKTPQVEGFSLGSDAAISLLICAPIFFVGFAPLDNPSPIFDFARYVHAQVGTSLAQNIGRILLGLHSLEALYTASLSRKHVSGFFAGTAYALSTVLLGFPVWAHLRKRIQAARIDSVMKVE